MCIRDRFSHNEAAYRAIEEGFKTNRIGAVVQATGTGKSYLIARYIVNHSEDDIAVSYTHLIMNLCRLC